jgi:hypothetical protein
MGLLIGATLTFFVGLFYYVWKRGNIYRRTSELLNAESGLDLSKQEATLLATDEFSDSQTSCWIAAIVGPIGIALLVLAWQALTWLRTADWPELPIQLLYSEFGLREPQVSWAGAQKIIDWFESLHVSFAFFAIAVLAAFLFTRNDDQPVPEDLKTARMKRARSLSSK